MFFLFHLGLCCRYLHHVLSLVELILEDGNRWGKGLINVGYVSSFLLLHRLYLALEKQQALLDVFDGLGGWGFRLIFHFQKIFIILHHIILIIIWRFWTYIPSAYSSPLVSSFSSLIVLFISSTWCLASLSMNGLSYFSCYWLFG